MVEIGEGEVLFRREELEVTLLVDSEHLAAVYSRAAPGWGRTPLHVHARHAEAVFVLEGELALRLEDRVHRLGPETWAFVPPEVVHTFEVTDSEVRFLVFHAPGSGYGDYVRGTGAPFDQQPPPEYATGDPGLVIVCRSGGVDGETIGETRPDRRATLLVDTDELTLTEFVRAPGDQGPPPHVHHEHADAFLVVEGELKLTLGSESFRGPPGTFFLAPPDVVHTFENDGAAAARFFNFHVPATGFADYMRGRNSDFDQHDPPADGGVNPALAVVVRLSA